MNADPRVRDFRWLKQIIFAHVDETTGAPVFVHQILSVVSDHAGQGNIHLLARMTHQVVEQRSPRVKMLNLEQIANALQDSVRVHHNEGLRIRVIIDLHFADAAAVIHALVLATGLVVAHE